MTDHRDDWTGSAHGREAEKKNFKTAVCSDCHTTHDIVGSSTDKAKLAITASCGDCHKDAYESYKASYHGQVNRLGYAYTAKCADCHGSHAIEPSKDPKSKMHEKNRLKTCQKCHSGKEGKPARSGDRRLPQLQPARQQPRLSPSIRKSGSPPRP
jgi:nitrate/TMAO reductase-like tetraheme cytochrome c subunit